MSRLIAVLSLAWACGAQAACESIALEVTPIEVKKDFTKTFRELVGMAGGVAYGLTHAKATAVLHNCVLTLSFNPMTLYVAKELREGTCEHNLVYEHETGHVRVYEQAVKTLPGRIDVLSKEMDDLIPAVQKALDEVRAANAAHDSLEEYDKPRWACQGRVVGLGRPTR